MRNLLLFLLLAIIPIALSGQSKVIDWGSITKNKKNAKIELLGIIENHYFVHQTFKRKTVISKYDMDHKQVDTYDFPRKNDYKTAQYDKPIVTSAGIFGFREFYDTKERKWKIQYTRLDSKPQEELKSLFEYDYKFAGDFLSKIAQPETYQNFGLHFFKVSQDKSKVALFRDNTSKVKGNLKRTFAVFDSEMNLVWEKKIVLEHDIDKSTITKSVVHDDGSLSIIVKVSRNRIKSMFTDLNSKFYAYKVTSDGFEEYQLDLGEDKIPIRVVSNKPENGTIKFIGFYGDKNEDEITGSFCSITSAEKGTLNNTFSKFATDFIDELSSGLLRTSQLQRLYFEIEYVLQFNDGSVAFTSQESKYKRLGNSGNYYCGNLIVSKYTKDGDLAKTISVEKNCVVYDKDYLKPYSTYLIGDEIHFLFFDLKTTTELKEFSLNGGKRSQFIDHVTINKQLEVTKDKTIYSPKESGLKVVPSLIEFHQGKFLVGARDYKSYRFGFLNIEK